MTSQHLLPQGPWTLEGRLVDASNVALRMAHLTGDEADQLDESTPRAVYKPVAGERPLADFPAATLAHREVAACLVAAHAGWPCVPETRWYSGEFGDGSLQRWVGPVQPQEQTCVALLDPADLDDAPHRCPIAAFETEDGPVVLAHTDDARLRVIAALDVVLNNADRKGSHVIEADGELFAVDNGLSFHTEDKLRTVLWGWAGEPLGDEVVSGLDRLVDEADRLTAQLRPHLSEAEIDALHARVAALRAAGAFPEPPAERYGLPWPPL